MCSISGICNFEKKPSIEIVELMTKLLSHRGPDDSGFFQNENVSFGHNRLSIIDLQNSKQPMKDNLNKNIIIFNGEIYNFKELKSDLQSLGHKFETEGDTEVVLKSYNQWGIECLKKLEGMFVFCIWDNKKKQLFIGRDKFGEKPLFYYFSKKYGFMFSSEIKSFLQVKEIKDELGLNLDSINQYLSLNYLINNKTFFNEIKSLSPASYIILNALNFKKEILIKKYWFLEEYFKKKTKDNFNQASEKIDFLLEKSIKQKMFSNVENGVFLSGGIDSSAISLKLKKIDNHIMSAHNILFKEKKFNESADAKIIADYLNINLNHYEVPINEDLTNEFPKIIDAMDQPMSDTSFVSTYYLSKYSKKKSKVVLSGDGADELFGGYDTYKADIYRKFFPRISFKSNLLKEIPNKIFKTNLRKIGMEYKINKFINGLHFKDHHSHILWREIFSYEEKKKLFNKFDKDLINHNFLNYVDRQIQKVKDLHYLDQYMYLDFKTWLPNDILYKVDRSTMYNSQESRLPFLDSELVEYVCSLPVEYKINIFERKKILRKIIKSSLPKSLLKKKKSGFNTPIGLWLINNKQFKDMSHDLLSTKFMQDLFNYDELINIWDSHQNMKIDQTYKIFNLISLSQWVINNNLENKL
tara:strand:+ start:9574 stop:11490 length:1917 start_codon:yes stop_codon:yes gene_type:complete